MATNVDKNLNCILFECTTRGVNNLLDSITIEICIEKNKSIRVSGSSIGSFSDWMEEMFFSKISRKVRHLLGFQY